MDLNNTIAMRTLCLKYSSNLLRIPSTGIRWNSLDGGQRWKKRLSTFRGSSLASSSECGITLLFAGGFGSLNDRR
jgi:hypothetical protein